MSREPGALHNLISRAVGNDDTKSVTLQFDPLLMQLFVPDSWTALWWEQRLQLRGKPLALWLHGYYASHADPYPIKVETLMNLCGSEAKSKRFFKKSLKEALNQLEKVAGTKAVFEGDLVSVEKIPSPSQGRHLIKKIIQENGQK